MKKPRRKEKSPAEAEKATVPMSGFLKPPTDREKIKGGDE